MTSDPGIFHGLAFEEYRRLPGISVSTLKAMRRSPLHYRHAIDHPSQPSASMTLGTATHAAILEPSLFEATYEVWNGTRRGKAWDEYSAACEADGKVILTDEEYRKVMRMRDAVRGYAPAAAFLKDGHAEVSMLWQHEESGLMLRGRIDWLTTMNGKPVLVGLKTAKTSAEYAFASQAAKLGYHMQWAYYLDGFLSLTGEMPRLVEIVVENGAPHEPALFNISDDCILQGREDYEALLKRVAECTATGHWPPAIEEAHELTLPSWAYSDSEDNDLSGLGLDYPGKEST